MYSLFSNTGSTVGQGILKDPNWLYVRDGLYRNLSNVINFNRTNPTAVKSNHFLVRLLQSIAVPQSQNTERYYINVDTMALNLSMNLKMTSPIFKGEVHKGVFYGDGSTEILIAHNEEFDPVKATKNWENQIPVKVLRHPFSDLGLIVPDGIKSSTDEGLSVIAINIPLLAIMYRAFRINENSLSTQMSEDDVAYTESERSIMMFLKMYVLPNMLPSHLDQAIFNRIHYLEIGAPLGDCIRKHSFYQVDYSARMLYIHNNILNMLHRVDKDFTGVLRSIPAVANISMFESMALPDIVETRQVLPAIFMARLNVLSFLFRIAKNGASAKNQSLVNEIRRTVRYYGHMGQLKTLLPYDIYFDTKEEINSIL